MWKTIDGFPDYEISINGEVRSYRPKGKIRAERRTSPYIMTGFRGERGYHSVMLRKPSVAKPHRRMVHRLVALAFLPNPNNLSDVAHNDGNPSNNNVSNLRWSTHYDNQMDMRQHGTMQDGEKSCTCKLSTEQVAEIREFAKSNGRGSGVILADRYGISKAQVSRIINGTRWRSTIV